MNGPLDRSEMDTFHSISHVKRQRGGSGQVVPSLFVQ